MEVPIPSSGYPDSVDSSPRSRGGESWDEPFPSPASAASRLRLMCSYGGRIVPRPTDKSLCYLGGETRIVVADRHSSLSDLHSRLSRTLPLTFRPFLIKYQLPSEDLDSLISVTTDEDLDNMVEEHDRLLQAAAGKPDQRSSRLRVFIFPATAVAYSGSLVEDAKSESWFVDALNGAVGVTGGLSADSASVNSLLGLEEASSPPLDLGEPEQIALQIHAGAGQDPGVEEGFANMHVTAAAAQQQVPPAMHLPTSLASPPSENPSGVFSDDERALQPNPSSVDAPGINSMPRQSMFYEERAPLATTVMADPKLEVPQHGHHRVQIQVPDQSMMPLLQKQFIQPNTQFVQMPSYYPVTAHPMQHPQQVYYVPIQQQNPAPPAYNLNMQAAALSDAASMKPVMPVANTTLPVASQLIHVPSDQSRAYAGLGYQFVHPHSGPANYGYEFTDPNQMQFYYAQSGASAVAPQYQPASSVPSIPEPQPVDLQQGRGTS